MQALKVTDVGSPADVIVMEESNVPLPAAGEVQLKVLAAGLGLPDLMMCKGEYAFSPELPFTPGQELCGVVSAVGEGCRSKIGDLKMGVSSFYIGNGSFAEYCTAQENSLYPMSQTMTPTQAAAFCIPFHTAGVGLINRGALRAGETVLVHGAAGGSGSAAIQLAKALGATVIATVSSDAKLNYCQSLGADHCINHQQESFVDKVLELTGGRGVDVVFDPVGGDLFEKSLSCTGSGGRLLAVGFASGRWGTADTNELVMRNCASIGVFVGACSREEMLTVHRELLVLYEAGKLAVTPEVSHGFESIVTGLDRLERREVEGKLVVLISKEYEDQ